MPEIHEIHELIYQHLIKKHEANPNFRFTTRITNRFKRLEKGYWFHGNDHYLVVSFWTGTDWMNKTPNIMFSTDFEECYLEISVWDSEVKRRFVDEYLRPKILHLEPGGKYYKYLDEFSLETIKDTLDNFIANEKKIIDDAITQYKGEEIGEDGNNIGSINAERFEWNIKKIEDYRGWLKAIKGRDEPYTLQSIKINVFGEIENCSLENIPPNNQCIFLTGENGTGKSTILKAIGAALMNDHSRLTNSTYNVELVLNKHKDEGYKLPIFFNSEARNGDIRIVTEEGYAAYGPYRLAIDEIGRIDGQMLDAVHANTSLFGTNAPLIDIEVGLNAGKNISDDIYMQQRLEIIEEVVSDIIPGFNGIIWGHKSDFNDEKVTKYKIGHASTMSADKISSYRFEELATGAKSVLGMVGDMMVRLIRLQLDEPADVSDLKGIVLIDEIDIHLHPTFQKLLVAQLAATFSKVQFIISTHSPIPLLGAPDNSIFYVVKKDYNRGTYVERIDNMRMKDLTPDTILTSPVFGMQNILHGNYDYDYEHPYKNMSFKDVRTESSWDGIKVADAELESLVRKYKQRTGGNND